MLNFYKNHLDQVLVLKLPDVLILAQYSDSSKMKVDAARQVSICRSAEFFETSGTVLLMQASLQVVSELTSLLLLLLGCAVQCERKEDFIMSIKNLDVSAQTVLMESIQQIADNPSTFRI